MFQICRRVFSIIVIIQLLHHETLYIMASQIQMERCPTMCICDIYKEFNTANCSGQHLISGYIGISSFVEWLDLSNNDITTIDNQCFYEFHGLNTLILDRNSISFIDLDAFVTLTELKSINLANNRLESFDNRIFEENLQLTNVDLSVNKFMHLPNEPMLKSKSLQTLDLHKSFLTHLHVKYFEELPNVRSIDLSENLLIVLNLAAFAVNNRLQELNINENRMKCDAQMDMSIVWLRRNNVRVNGATCLSAKKPTSNISPTSSPIFERMQALSNPIENGRSTEMSTINATETPIDLNSVWRMKKYRANAPILNEECQENEVNTNACHLFKMCASNLTFLIMVIDQKISSKNPNPNDNLSNSRHIWCEFVTVQVAFYGGLFLGAMLGAIALFTMKLISDCVKMSKCGCNGTASNKRKRNRHHHSYKSEIRCNNADCLNGSIEDNVNQNELISQINYENDENLRTNSERRQRSSTSIFAILYERPVRRRYYRQFNRNATNLVRRLSQSRLFLNSSRTQNATNRNARSHHRDNDNNNNNNNNNQTNIVQASKSNQVETENDIEFDRDVNEMAEAHEIMLPMAQTHCHNNDCISVHSLNIIIHGNNNIGRENQLNLNRRTFAASETDILRHCVERIETPPPPYDIVAE